MNYKEKKLENYNLQIKNLRVSERNFNILSGVTKGITLTSGILTTGYIFMNQYLQQPHNIINYIIPTSFIIGSLILSKTFKNISLKKDKKRIKLMSERYKYASDNHLCINENYKKIK